MFSTSVRKPGWSIGIKPAEPAFSNTPVPLPKRERNSLPSGCPCVGPHFNFPGFMNLSRGLREQPFDNPCLIILNERLIGPVSLEGEFIRLEAEEMQ